jgi:hypothetical protein
MIPAAVNYFVSESRKKIVSGRADS